MHSPYLIGQSVYLRPVELYDVTLIQTWHNDPEIRKLALGGRLPYTKEAEEEDIKTASQSDKKAYLMIVKKSDDKPIGFIPLDFWDPFCGIVWLRIIIGDKNSWGQGYGSDALRCTLCWLFQELNVHRVELETFATNERALNFFKKIGFKQEGVRRQAHFSEGQYHDVVLFSLLKEEFLNEEISKKI